MYNYNNSNKFIIKKQKIITKRKTIQYSTCIQYYCAL